MRLGGYIRSLQLLLYLVPVWIKSLTAYLSTTIHMIQYCLLLLLLLCFMMRYLGVGR